MRRPTPPPNGASGAMDAGQLLMGLPDLLLFLTDAVWDDGKPRELGTFTIFAQDGRWKVSLNDRDMERFTILTGSTIEECVEAADRALRSDDVVWRESGSGRRKRR